MTNSAYQWEMGFAPLEQTAWRKTTKSSRLELDVGMLGRGKVIWNFQSLAESGGVYRQTGNVKIFMDIQDADTMIFRLKSGYNPERHGGIFWKSKPMGTPAANLKESRGGCAEYREMTIKLGTKTKFVIYAMKCDGQQDKQGLIQAIYANKVPQNRTGITIGMEIDEMISMLSTLERELLAYRTSQYILAGMQQDYAYEVTAETARPAATPAQTPQKQEQTKAEQAKTEQKKSDPTKAEQAKPEQAKPEQTKPDPVKAEQSKPSKPKSADEGFSWEDIAGNPDSEVDISEDDLPFC